MLPRYTAESANVICFLVDEIRRSSEHSYSKVLRAARALR